MKQKSVLERYIDALTKTGDVTLRWWLQKQDFKRQLLSPSEANRIAAEIAPYVVKRLSATVDVSDIVREIDKLNESIERLGR